MCVCVCVSGYAFRHALRYGAEAWHGDRGQGPEAQEHILEVTPSNVKGQDALEMPYSYQIWPEEPLTRVWCIAGVKGHVRVSGVNQRSTCLEMPYGNQIW